MNSSNLIMDLHEFTDCWNNFKTVCNVCYLVDVCCKASELPDKICQSPAQIFQ